MASVNIENNTLVWFHFTKKTVMNGKARQKEQTLVRTSKGSELSTVVSGGCMMRCLAYILATEAFKHQNYAVVYLAIGGILVKYHLLWRPSIYYYTSPWNTV